MRHLFALFVLMTGLASLTPWACAQTNPSVAGAALVPDPALALRRYEEGKRLYDAGNYHAAKAKFADAAQAEPNNPRWYFNLGLAHRQLDQFEPARAAFLQARALDANYKAKEIDEKLQTMGAGGSGGAPDGDGGPPKSLQIVWPVLLALLAFLLLLIAGLVWLVRRIMRSGEAESKVDPAVLAAEEARLKSLSGQLTLVEHAMRFGENADLRHLLEHATQIEALAYTQLREARAGDEPTVPQGPYADMLGGVVDQAVALAKRLHGAAAFAEQGERIACFFCARPLANPDYRRQVTMKQGESQEDVLSCPDCATLAARGESPRIRTANNGQGHWSESPSFDPYVARHRADHARRVPAWDFHPQQPVSQLAKLASGGALLGAGVLAGAGAVLATRTLLDLDAARQSGLAKEAAREAALQASDRNEKSRSFDHS